MMPEVDMYEGAGRAKEVNGEVQREMLRYKVLPERPCFSFPALRTLGNAAFDFPASPVLERPRRRLE